MIKKLTERKRLAEEARAKKKAEKDETKEVELDEEGNIIEKEPEDDDGEEEEEEEIEDEYLTWFKDFGPALKMGAIEDAANRERILKLLRFKSSANEDDTKETRTLQEYIDNMAEWQTQIYYMPGDDLKAIKKSEFLGTFLDKGLEVLYFDHPIDEYMTNHANDFNGKSFQSITKAGVKLEDEDKDVIKRREKVYKAKFKPVYKFFKEIFGESLTRVKISKRCGDAPALLSAEQHGMSSNMERVIKSQARATGIPEHSYRSHRVFEYNPRHPFLVKLNEMITPPEDEEDSDKDFVSSPEAIDIAWYLHDTAVLNSGYTIMDIPEYTARMHRLIQVQMELDDVELEDEINPEPTEEDDDMEDPDMDDLDAEIP